MNNPKLDGDFGIVSIVKNTDGMYIGNLVEYFKIIVNHARNLRNPYHNFRHMFYVLWTCHDACLYYMANGQMSGRDARNLLVAALFHDFDHSGRTGEDDLEITRAVRSFTKHCEGLDQRPYFADIVAIIVATKYPYKTPSSELSLSCQIIRDADASQGLDKSWIQQIVFGLGEEINLSPYKMLNKHADFLSKLTFTTEWAREIFDEAMIAERLAEVRSMLIMLD